MDRQHAVLAAVEEARDELIALTRDLIRFPTVNPPGEAYEPCARFIGETLARFGYAVEYLTATDRPEHTPQHPRTNVIGRRGSARPVVHFNGHIDVVPPGNGWTTDPFQATVRDGRLYGRGAADMKGGLACAIIAAEAVRRAGVSLPGSVEISGTVDEESGGWAGVAHLARIGRLTAESVDHVIIPEPLQVDRVCIGHRGVWWADLITRGRIAHGSMPSLGVNAVEHMGEVLHEIREHLQPALLRRTTSMPVVPDASRRATLNINSISGGQAGHDVQSPCVADECLAILDRRFLLEESFGEVRQELVALLESLRRRIPDFRWELHDRMIVEPVETPPGSPVVGSVSRAIAEVLGREAQLVASPGTYDHKHFTRIGGIVDCVAYGPGVLEVSHLPDEWVDLDDLVHAAQVMALALMDLQQS